MFFGRGSDIEALNSLIFIKQTVVLYGKSGYGKSSLINAGIIPKLKENDAWSYFTIRFNNYSGRGDAQNVCPAETVRQRLAEGLTINDGDILDRAVPRDDSFWYLVKKHQLQRSKVNYIFFFDQFEELFTYPREQVNEFSEQLGELLYSTMPLKFKRRIAEMDNSDAIDHAEHDFLYEKPEIKVVFSIRSDRLALLNSLTDKHPTILQHCYELNALSLEDARRAVIEPAGLPRELGFATAPFTFTEKAVDAILRSVADPQEGKIEAATLQIVCRYVEDSLVGTKNVPVIDESDLGDITDIFQQYYQGILNKLAGPERIKAQHLIEDELIDAERRNPLSATYIKAKFGLSDALLLQLEQSSLLRKERDAAGRLLYEVSHDSLVSAIERVARGRRAEEEDQHKADLERRVVQERNRAEELQVLNKKANSRLRLAIGLVVVSAIIAIAAVYFKLQANEQEAQARENLRMMTLEKQKVEEEKQKAEREKNVADSARYASQKATEMAFVLEKSNYGVEFFQNGNYRSACGLFRMADSVLSKYPEETVWKQKVEMNMKRSCGR